MSNLSRRSLLLALLMAANSAALEVMAKDGDSGGGSGNSGSGSSNSGHGGDDDDDDDDDDSDDDSGGRRDNDHDRAIKAVKRGKAVSLTKLRDHLSQNYPGKVLDVSLRRSSGDYFYNVRILAKGNRLRVLSLNALTLKPRSK